MTAPISQPLPSDQFLSTNQRRGIASLTFNGKVLRFRTNPNSVWWSYLLKTNVEQTYGGRVVQILGVGIDDLVVKVECGRGGWPEAKRIVDFLRQVMIDQRKGKNNIGDFKYTTRNWHMKVYALSVPFQDQVNATTRELELHFKVQEDVSQVQSQAALSAELTRLRDGVGFVKMPGYNVPTTEAGSGENPSWMNGAVSGPGIGNLLGTVTSFAGAIPGLGGGLSFGGFSLPF
jgi:hypothetical protein